MCRLTRFPQIQRNQEHGKADDLGHPDRPQQRSRAGRHAAQDHHQPRLSRASGLFRGQRPKIINLSNSYAYQSRGYYASLLAGSRGHKVIPTVETMIDLSERKLYENALPELEVALNKCRKELGGGVPGKGCVLLRHRPVEGLGPLRPAAVRLVPRSGAGGDDRGRRRNGHRSTGSAFYPLGRMTQEEKPRFLKCLEAYTRREWRATKARTPPRYSFATLFDPNEELPPSEISFAAHWSRIAEKMGVEVEPITRRDLAGSPNSTRCSSARRRRSPTTPTVSPAAQSRKACRSSTTRSR